MDARRLTFCTLLALAIAAAAMGTSGAAEAAGVTAKSKVEFVVRIPNILRLKSLSMQRTLEIPTGARVVDVADASRFEVLATVKTYALRFEITDPDVIAVEIEGLGEMVRAEPGGTVVHFTPRSPAERRVLRALTYRVHMGAGAAPGPRPMPLVVSIVGT